MIADTSYLIDVMRGDLGAINKGKKLEVDGVPIHLASITVFELYVGIGLSKKSAEEKAIVHSVISSMPVLSLDFDSACEGGLIFSARKKEGKTMDPEDAMVAGIAKLNHETILTRNTRHFSGIEGVRVEGY
jgi:predicted nucleic acid-binding protein